MEETKEKAMDDVVWERKRHDNNDYLRPKKKIIFKFFWTHETLQTMLYEKSLRVLLLLDWINFIIFNDFLIHLSFCCRYSPKYHKLNLYKYEEVSTKSNGNKFLTLNFSHGKLACAYRRLFFWNFLQTYYLGKNATYLG